MNPSLLVHGLKFLFNIFCQLFILRAEYELQSISGDQSNGLGYLDSLKSHISSIFGSHAVNAKSATSPEKGSTHGTFSDRHELFKPRTIGKTTVGYVRYKGDWMRRPASGEEIAWLTDLLVRLSAWLNEKLELDTSHETRFRSGFSVDISNVSEGEVYGTTDTVKMLATSVASWLAMLGLGVVDLLRKHGFRINLRFIASKKVLISLFVIFLVLSLVRKCFALAAYLS